MAVTGVRKTLNRRTVLRGLAAAAGVTGLSLPASAAWGAPKIGAAAESASTRDYSTRETYDWLIATVGSAAAIPNRTPANEQGFWAWNLAPVLRTYPLAYRAWNDTRYLDALIADADLLLSERDNVRGVNEYRGLSLPNWRQGGQYTTGSVEIPDQLGAPVLRIREGYLGPNDGSRGTATISSGTSPGRFNLTVTTSNNTTSTFTNLTLDPTSADYIVPRLYWDSPNLAIATAVDIRTTPATGDLPKFGTYAVTADFNYNLVDTGVMVLALAEFAALVAASPSLQRRKSSTSYSGRNRVVDYAEKAEEYAVAVAAALAVHDAEWRENTSGEGWYIIDPESPQGWAGADRPHNQNLAVGAAYIYLATATGDVAYRDRAEMLFRRFKNDLILTTSGAYVWHYNDRGGWFFSGWTAEDHISQRIPAKRGYQPVEDIGHATLDLACVATAARNNVIFNAQDMQRFANTFTQNIAPRDPTTGQIQVTQRVDGTGTPAPFNTRAGSFGLLRPWSELAYDTALEIFDIQQPGAGRASLADSIGTLATFGSGNL